MWPDEVFSLDKKWSMKKLERTVKAAVLSSLFIYKTFLWIGSACMGISAGRGLAEGCKEWPDRGWSFILEA